VAGNHTATWWFFAFLPMPEFNFMQINTPFINSATRKETTIVVEKVKSEIRVDSNSIWQPSLQL
jgi:hypothetical protein